jgi:hypothetical protein
MLIRAEEEFRNRYLPLHPNHLHPNQGEL